MSKTTIIIALLDKSWPPQHSFVDGMLAGEAAKESDIKVRLCVSHARSDDTMPQRYRGAACLPLLYPRRGFGRFRNLLAALKLLHYQIQREQKRGNRIVLFVRNDPVYLLAASLLRRKVDRLVFQSSFPHEEHSGIAIKRWAARALYRLSSQGVDVVTGVSPEGVIRTQGLCPHAAQGPHIPLLSDMPPFPSMTDNNEKKNSHPIFLYIGTHRPPRELETVLTGIVDAVRQGARGHFCFIGAAEEDETRLLKTPGVRDLVDRKLIQFKRPVPRQELPQIMSKADVGISLIPPKAVYYESSPTKLAEYMGAGLAVLASKGIPMQERFLKESNGGILVDWGPKTIAEGIRSLCDNPEILTYFKANASFFSESALQYRAYLPDFLFLIRNSSQNFHQ